jgi:hypothetical protein
MLGIRAPAAQRARPQGARAGEGLRECRGRLGSADRAEVRGSGKGKHSGASGQAGDRETVPSEGAKRVSSDIGDIPGKVGGARSGDGRPSTRPHPAEKPGIRRALGSSGFSRACGRTPAEPSPLISLRNDNLSTAAGPARRAAFPPAARHAPVFGHPVRFPGHLRPYGPLTLTR